MLPTLSQLNVSQPMGQQQQGVNLMQQLQHQMQMPIPAQDAILPNTDFSLGIKCLFKARHPLEYIAPLKKKYCRLLDPVLNPFDCHMQAFEDEDPPEVVKPLTTHQIRNNLWLQSHLNHSLKQKQLIKEYHHLLPTYANNPGLTQDPLKTLFISKLNYQTTEATLRKFFKEYGSIKNVKIVQDREGKSRGYAFIEYEHKSDFKRAYKESDGRKIDGRKVLVDCERGRVVENWVPKRLGGGKGDSRKITGEKALLLEEYLREQRRRERSRSRSRKRKHRDNKNDKRDKRDKKESKKEDTKDKELGEIEMNDKKKDKKDKRKKEDRHRDSSRRDRAYNEDRDKLRDKDKNKDTDKKKEHYKDRQNHNGHEIQVEEIQKQVDSLQEKDEIKQKEDIQVSQNQNSEGMHIEEQKQTAD